MCRLLGITLPAAAPLASALRPGEMDLFTAMSERHKDGWGVAAQVRAPGDAAPRVALVKDVGAARDSSLYRGAIEHGWSDQAVVHLRRASTGLALRVENSHPFVDEDLFGYPVVFAHNGEFPVAPELREFAVREGRMCEGTTDSEVFFGVICAFARSMSWPEAIGRAIDAVEESVETTFGRQSEGLNVLLATPWAMYAVAHSDPSRLEADSAPETYRLQMRQAADGVVISSVYYPGVDYVLREAELLDDDVVIEVRRGSLDVTRHGGLVTRPSRQPALEDTDYDYVRLLRAA